MIFAVRRHFHPAHIPLRLIAARAVGESTASLRRGKGARVSASARPLMMESWMAGDGEVEAAGAPGL